MASNEEEVLNIIQSALLPEARGRLLARGMARSLIWKDGRLPLGGPKFSKSLTADLLDYGYGLLSTALYLWQNHKDREHQTLNKAFLNAAEAIEAAIIRGKESDRSRGFHRVVASAAFHLAGYAARSYCMLPSTLGEYNLSPAEIAFGLLVRRDLGQLEAYCMHWLNNRENQDATIAHHLRNDGAKALPNALATALTGNFIRSLHKANKLLRAGPRGGLTPALITLRVGKTTSSQLGTVTFWWLYSLSSILLEELWKSSFHQALPREIEHLGRAWRTLRHRFIGLLASRGRAELELWPSQIEAARRAFDPSDNIVVSLPTSAGKTRIAELCILRALVEDRRVFFVTPLRALSAQTERTLSATFSPLGYSVSSLYGAAGETAGDEESLRRSKIVIATPEKLHFAIRNSPDLLDDVGLVVLDEGHMLGIGEREIRYEALIQSLLRRNDASTRRLICLSAIFPDGEQLEDFVAWIRRDEPGTAARSQWRPTRQQFGEILWREFNIALEGENHPNFEQGSHARLEFRIEDQEAFVPRFFEAVPPSPKYKRRKNFFPSGSQEITIAAAWKFASEGQNVLIFCPQKTSVEPLATAALKAHKQGLIEPLVSNPQHLETALKVGKEWLGLNHPAVESLKLGLIVHHANLPRPFLTEVEQLLKEGVCKIIIASPTLAQGLNLSAGVLLLSSIYRYGKPIPAEEFANVVGRAGRAFVDLDGKIFHIFSEKSHREERRKVRAWRNLIDDTAFRDLRSGIYRLTKLILEKIHAETGGSSDDVVEYALNAERAWIFNGELVLANLEDSEDPDEALAQAQATWLQNLESLDVALLSLLENHDLAPESLATALDDALRGSLCKRALERDNEGDRKESEAVLVGRAQTIWQSTSTPERRGFYRAGVGLNVGHDLRAQASSLGELLDQADTAIALGEYEKATIALAAFAEIVFEITPFRPRTIPKGWQKVLNQWLLGTPVSSSLAAHGNDAVDFIQDGLVYRLVWALEAVRVFLDAQKDGSTHDIDADYHGLAARALEVGAMNMSAATLLEAGFASRSGALSAVEQTNATFTSRREMRIWLRGKRVRTLSTHEAWPTPDSATQWKVFLKRQSSSRTDTWKKRILRLVVKWEQPVPPAEARLDVIFDPESGLTHVCDRSLKKLGTLRRKINRIPLIQQATVASDSSERVEIRYYGPKILRTP